MSTATVPGTLSDDRVTQAIIDAAEAELASSAETAPEPLPATGVVSPCAQSVLARLDSLDRRVSALEHPAGNGHGPIVVGPLPAPDMSVGNPGTEAIQVNPRPGQVVNGPGNSGGATTPTPAPALSKNQGPDPINHIGYMTTTATVNQQGVLYASTNTRSAQMLAGFTGGVFAVVADASGAIIARSAIRQYGVDGTWIPGSVSNRTDNWTENFGPDVVARGHTLGIVHIGTRRTASSRTSASS